MKGRRIQRKNKENKVISNKKKIVLIITILILLVITAVIVYFILKPRIKKEVIIELGETQQLQIEQFLEDEKYKDKATFITDTAQIDLSKTGEYDIKIKYNEKEFSVKLKVQDTKPPEVEFQDIEKPMGYELNAEDFIKSKTDASQMTVTIQNAENVNTQEFGEYTVNVKVEDEHQNKTEKECKITITYIKEEYNLELGTKLTKEDLIYDIEKAGGAINQADIDDINGKGPGEYELHATYNGVEKTVKIKVQDTKPPELNLKDITIYVGEQIQDLKQFIVSVTDVSEVTTNILTTPDFSKQGEQEITVEAVDKYGNKTTKTAKLNIVQDTTGPVISGLKDITITKGGSIDYKKGVSATDAKDGTVEFNVDSSSVNIQTAGTYYATYTAKDKSNNTTTNKRKIVVQNSASDVYQKADEIMAKATKGVSGTANKIIAVKNYIRKNVKYSHKTTKGIEKAAWQAFTTYDGDCYIHAAATQLILTRMGVKSIIVNALDYTHYWNLVYINGKYRHIDPTPGWAYDDVDFMDDAKRLETLRRIQGYGYRDWDRSKFPAAN